MFNGKKLKIKSSDNLNINVLKNKYEETFDNKKPLNKIYKNRLSGCFFSSSSFVFFLFHSQKDNSSLFQSVFPFCH